jgi:hypothetical protein
MPNPHPIHRLRALLGAVVLLLATGCGDVSITTVPPALVEIEPGSSFLAVDATSRLTARVRSNDGALLSGRAITWTSSDPAIAEVDEDGDVHGLSPGTATIRATAEGISGTATVTVTERPAIASSGTSVTFAAAQGGSDPSAQNITISNAGGGTLSGLSANVSYAAGQPTGWLSAQLGATTAPTTLALSATTGTLATGSYSATVNVTSDVAQNSPYPITVTFNVGSAPPMMSVAPGSLAFTAVQGGANPGARSIEVTNSGGGTLSGLSVSVTYPGGQPSGWLATGLSGATAPATIIVTASTGSLAPGNYSATVSVSGSAANSPQQVPVTFEVQAPSVPGAPTGLSATAMSSSRIDLSWSAASGLVSRYRIERRTESGSFAVTDSVAAGTLSYQDTGLSAGTLYFYRVQACNASGCSAYSAEASATTDSDGPLTPGVVVGVSASATSSTQITVSWTYGSDVITHFELQRAPGSNPDAFQTLATVGALARSFGDTGLSPATTYRYRLRACNLTLCSDWSEVAEATTQAVTPSAPSNLVATAISDSAIQLTWDAAPGATTYEIQRRRGNSGSWDFRTAVPADSTQYLDTGLNEDTRYQYQVRACAGDLCSSYSNTATATTFD